jgi:hypothetical protein
MVHVSACSDSPTLPLVPSGGDVADCLSSVDLDRLMQPLLGEHWLPARTLHDVRTGRLAATIAAERICERVTRLSWLVAPIHTRHHWSTVVWSKQSETISAVVYDSAPSPITRRDFLALFARLRLTSPSIVCHARQPRSSNECGLNVVFIALMQWRHWRVHGEPASWSNAPTSTIDLAAWRHTLSTLPGAVTDRIADKLLASPGLPLPEQPTTTPCGAGPSSLIHALSRPERLRKRKRCCLLASSRRRFWTRLSVSLSTFNAYRT